MKSMFKEVLVGNYVLRFTLTKDGWTCSINDSMMDAVLDQENQKKTLFDTDHDVTAMIKLKEIGDA